jgi:uncharacterized protein YrrD
MNNTIDHSMLRNIKPFYRSKLHASDGEIGHVSDFYFDDQKWVVRYVVVDTGSWLPGRLVLISPHAFGDVFQHGDWLPVKLTRKQIETSPVMESQRPVSRQYEAEYCRYYGYPSYWDGIEMWGAAGFPVAQPPTLMPIKEDRRFGSIKDEDPHLRSTKALDGYHIQTKEGQVGHITDFVIDEKSWAICHLVIETGHWLFGKEIAISPSDIDRISYEESMVYVNVTKDSIREAQQYDVPLVGGESHQLLNFNG